MRIDFSSSFIFAFTEELQKSRNKIYHLASNPLPHYRGKFECSTVQLFCKAVQFGSDAKPFSYSKYLSEMLS